MSGRPELHRGSRMSVALKKSPHLQGVTPAHPAGHATTQQGYYLHFPV